MTQSYSKMTVLATLLEKNPILWEMLHPHTPKVSQVFLELMVADVLKAFAAEAKDQNIQKQLLTAGSQIIDAAAGSLRKAWEEGDGICPEPWPWPIPVPKPFPFPPTNPWPNPDPWPWPFPVPFPFPFPFPSPLPDPWPGPWPQPLSKLGFDERTFMINSLKLTASITQHGEAGKMMLDAANQLQHYR